MAKMEGLRQLGQIRAYAKNIIEALEDETLDSLIHTKSNMLQDAISYRFLIMGECSETILRKCPKVEMKYPKLPLRAMGVCADTYAIIIAGQIICFYGIPPKMNYPIWLTRLMRYLGIIGTTDISAIIIKNTKNINNKELYMKNTLNTAVGKKHGAESNIEKFVRLKVQEVKQLSLAKDFLHLYENRNCKKVTMWLEPEICDFYRKFGKGYQTKMKIALKTVMQALEAGKIKLPE